MCEVFGHQMHSLELYSYLLPKASLGLEQAAYPTVELRNEALWKHQNEE